MFRKRFSYKNPEELRQTLIETTDEKYELLKNQINTKAGVSCTRLENLVNVVEYILDSAGSCDDIPDLEIEESAAKKRKQPGRGLKILTPSQMLSSLPISLAQLKAGNNSEKLKNEIENYYTLCTDQKNLQNNSIKV